MDDFFLILKKKEKNLSGIKQLKLFENFIYINNRNEDT